MTVDAAPARDDTLAAIKEKLDATEGSPAVQENVKRHYENLEKLAANLRKLGMDERDVSAEILLVFKQYEQALNYQQLLRKQIGEVELSCAQDGVTVKLDGKLVLTGPGTTRALLLLGEHQLVASKQGLRTAVPS